MKITITVLRRLPFLVFLGALLAGTAALANTTNTWTGAGTPDGNWTNANNWLNFTNSLPNTPATNDVLIFSGATQLNTTNNFTNGAASLVFNGITFSSGAGAYVLYGNSITPGSGLTDNATAVETINLPIVLGATHSFSVGLAGGNMVINYPISGAQAISQTGLGTLTLNGTNTFTGAINGIAGTLTIGTTGELNNGNYAGAITNSGIFNFNGMNAQTLSGAISNGVGATINLGGTAAQTVSGAVVNNGTITFSGAAAATLSGAVSGTGALNQNGNGALTLSGTATYTGATAVNAGELIVSTASSSSVGTVTLAGTATNAVQVTAAGGQWISTGLTYSAGTVWQIFNFFQPPSSAVAPLQVNGNVAFNGTLNIVINTNGSVPLVVGAYPLIKYTGTLSGTPPTVAFALPGKLTGTIVNNTANKSIDMDITGGGNQVTWATGSGIWDTSTLNWTFKNPIQPAFPASSAAYSDGDFVVFEDVLSGASPIAVTLNTTVNPTNVLFNNSVKNYTIAGTGVIAGGTSLSKDGSGRLTLTNSEAYTGGTILNSGTTTLDFSGGAINDILNGNSALILGGASLNIIGNPNVTNPNEQDFASTTFAEGSAVMTVGPASGTTPPTVNLGPLTYTVGSTVVFNGPSYSTGVSSAGGQTGAFGNADPVTGLVPALANIITSSGGVNTELTGSSTGVSPGTGTSAQAGFATVGAYDFAIVVGLSPYTIIGASQGTAQTGTGAGVNGSDGAYTLLNAGNTGGGNGGTGGPWDLVGNCGGHNTDNLTAIRFNAPGAATFNAAGGTVSVGAILVTPNVGPFNIAMTAFAPGLRSGSNPGSVVIWQNNTNGYFNITGAEGNDGNSAGGAFVQAGPGTVNYTAANTYTGPTFLNGGVSEIYADSGLGAPATGATLTLNGGTLMAGASFALDNAGANKRPITLGFNGGGLAAVSNTVFNVDGVISATANTGPLFIGIPASSANGNVAGLVPGTGPNTANLTPTNALGTVVLSGVNTYPGGTVIYSGILNFNSGSLGSGSVTLNGGTLQWAAGSTLDISIQGLVIGPGGGTLDLNGNNVTLVNPIAGSGALSVTNGTLTLSGANTYAGGTVVGSGSTLIVNNATGSATGGGNITVQNGGTLTGTGTMAGSLTVAAGGNVSPGVGVGTLTVGAVGIGPVGTFIKPGANFNFEFSATTNDQIVVTTSGGLALSGGAINVLQAGSPFGYITPGIYKLIQYSGTIGGTGLDNTWTTASPFNPHIANQQAGVEYAFNASGGYLTLTITANSSVTVGLWDVDANGNWSGAPNWISNTVPNSPGSEALFGIGSALRTVTLDASETVGVAVFTNSHSFVVAAGGGTLTLDNSGGGAKLNVSGGNTNAIGSPVSLNDNVTATLGTGDSLAISGNIVNAHTAEALAVTGAGTLQLSGANTYGPSASGTVGTILGTGATLRVGSSTALGAGDVDVVASSTIQQTGTAVSLGNNIDVAPGVAATLDSEGVNLTLGGTITDSGSLVKIGSGTVTLNNSANNYTGGTTLKGGSLIITTDSDLGAVTPLVFNGGGLEASGAVSMALARNFVVGLPTGTVGTNAYLDAATGSSLTVQGSIAGSGNLGLNNLIVNSFAGSTAGTVYLQGPGSFSGTTTVSNGVLQLLGNGNGTVPTDNQSLAGSTLVANPGGAIVFDSSMLTASIGQLSGSANVGLSNASGQVVTLSVGGNNGNALYAGGLTDGGLVSPFIKNGTGTLTLSGSNNYTGVTTVNAGTLAITNGGILNVGTLAGQGYLVNGGLLTNASTTVNSLGQVANAFLETAGTVNIGELTQANNDGMLVEITGGTFISPNVRLLRDNNYAAPTAAAPVAALTTVGFYINSTNTLSPAQVYLGLLTIAANGANSSSSMRMDAGSLTVTNAVTIGAQNATVGRWDIMQINGGNFTNLDTASGVVIANNSASQNDSELYLSGGSNYVQLINFGTGGDIGAGLGFMFITNSTLYVGSGGINMPNASGLYVPTIVLDSGLLGATANWSSSITPNGSGTGWLLPVSATNFTIQAADPHGVAYNITLSGGISGAGSLLKTGGGSLILGGTNNWTGTTTINAGTLALNDSLNLALLTSPTITVATGATFDLSASAYTLSSQTEFGSGTNNGSFTFGPGCKVYAGLAGAYATNTFNNNLVLGSGVAAYLALGLVHNQSNGLFTVGGNLTLDGNPIHITAPNTTSNLDTADYVLFNVTGTITGSVPSTPVWDVKPTNATSYAVITNSHQVVLHYYSATALPPTGNGSINPSVVYDNETGLVTVTVTNGTSTTIQSVVLNASSIGLSSTLGLVSTGVVNVYTNSITIPPTAAQGGQTLTAQITDGAGLTATVAISLTISPGKLWTGLSSTDANWSDNANWIGNVGPLLSGDEVTFAGVNRLGPLMDNGYSVVGISFASAAGSFILGPSTATVALTGGVTNSSVNLETVNMAIAAGAPVTFNAATGPLSFGQPIDNGGFLLTITDGGFNTTVSNGISDAGGLTKSGPGTNTLLGANSYTGNTIISAGALVIGPAGQLGSGVYGGTIANAGTLSYNSANAQTLTGVISGAGALNYGGPAGGGGILSLNGASSFTGNITISNGTVSDVNQQNAANPTVSGLGNPQTAGRTATVNSNGVLSLDGSTSPAGNEFGNGTTTPALAFIINQGGVMQITAGNAGIGALTLNGGTLLCYPAPSGTTTEYEPFELGSTVTTGGTFPSLITNTLDGTNSGLNLGINAATGQTTFTVSNTGAAGPDLTVAVPLMDSGGLLPGSSVRGLIKAGPGRMALTDQNLYHGVTTINAGILTAGSAETPGVSGPLGTSPAVNPGSIAFGGGTLQYSAVNHTDYSSRFSAAAGQLIGIDTAGQNVTFGTALTSSGGTLTKLGAGTLTLTGANAYTGATTISNGTLALSSGSSLSVASSLSIAGGATFNVTALASYTLGSGASLTASSPATIAGTGTISLGSRPIILNYDGVHPALALTSGTLSLNGNAFTVNGPVLFPGSYVLVQAPGTITSAGTYTVSGTVIGSPYKATLSVSGAQVFLNISVNTQPTMTFTLTGGGKTLNFAWPSAYLGWTLQSNSVSVANPNTWFNISGSGAVTNESITITTTTNVFFRLDEP